MTFSRYFYENYISLKEGRYNDDGKFILWAKRIAHNLIIDHLG
jgi:RNA polymerase sigma-70 factor (ECF subfamily)